MHDPRIGRFFAIDPLSPKYPHYTPYSFSGNKLIGHRELEGLEERIAILYDGENCNGEVCVVSDAADVGANLGFNGIVVDPRTIPRTVPRTVPRTAPTRVLIPGGQYLLGFAAMLISQPLDAPNLQPLPDFDPIPEDSPLPLDDPIPDPTDEKGEEEEWVTLYRGVHVDHPAEPMAKLGMAIPGSDDPNDWSPDALNGGNSAGNYATAWSESSVVATYHANKRGIGGVLLTKKFKKSDVDLWRSPDIFDELEVAVPGPVFGADVSYPTAKGHPSWHSY